MDDDQESIWQKIGMPVFSFPPKPLSVKLFNVSLPNSNPQSRVVTIMMTMTRERFRFGSYQFSKERNGGVDRV